MPHEVFISYRHEDQEWAGRVCGALESRGIGCWVASRDIAPGADWPAEIMSGLKRSKFFVVILSSNSINEEQISREVRIAADDLKLRIFPIRIEDVQPPAKVGYFLGDIQWLDVFDGKFEPAMDRLVALIRGAAAAVPSVAAVSNPPASTPVSKPFLRIAISVAVVVVIAIAALLVLRPRSDGIPKAVKETATGFLADLGNDNLQSAWDRLTPERRAEMKYPKWNNERHAYFAKYGSSTPTLVSCQQKVKNQVYVCDFNLFYPNRHKTMPATVNVSQEKNGSFGVDVEKSSAPD